MGRTNVDVLFMSFLLVGHIMHVSSMNEAWRCMGNEAGLVSISLLSGSGVGSKGVMLQLGQ
jgi:hypothetical protein